MVDAYIYLVPKIARSTPAGTDFQPRSFQLGRVPLDPMPDWVPARRREIGVRIRAGRRAARLTQEQLAEHIGRDRKTIVRWENAYSVPDLDDLLLLADALDIPLADLVR